MERGRELPSNAYCVPEAAISVCKSDISLNVHIT